MCKAVIDFLKNTSNKYVRFMTLYISSRQNCRLSFATTYVFEKVSLSVKVKQVLKFVGIPIDLNIKYLGPKNKIALPYSFIISINQAWTNISSVNCQCFMLLRGMKPENKN